MISIAKQLSVFVENKPGRIGVISETLHKVGVNIKAMMIADAGEFGIINLIVDDQKRGKDVLAGSGFTVSEADVLIIEKETSDPDDILKISKILKESNLNVQYAYGMSYKETLFVLKTNNLMKAIEVLKRFF